MSLSLCESGLLNCSQILGQAVIETTSQTTGSLFLTFTFIMLMFIAAAAVFGIKLEWTIIIVMPLLLGLMSYYQDFLAFGGVIIIYLAILLTKNFIIK